MSNEELVDLIRKGINPGDNMEQLYIQNKGFIFNVIRKYRYACQSDYNSTPIIEIEELMNEAYFGLIEATNRFDPDQGVLFLTYAAYWISQAVKRFLENSGQMIRVPVHTQERVYKYNQLTSYYLRTYDRYPEKQEYAQWIGIALDTLDRLEKFMFHGATRSLDEIIPGSEDDSLSLGDTVASDVDIENDIVEKIFQEQIKEEIWDIVAQVLKDDKKVRIMKMRFISGLTLEQIAEKIKVSRTAIDQTVKQCFKMIRRNSRTRRLIVEMGFWDEDKPINIRVVKVWAERGMLSAMDNKELAYARRMGWMQDELKQL